MESVEGGRDAILARIRAPVNRADEVVNSLPEPDTAPFPALATGARARRRATRHALRQARRRKRHPEKYRIAFPEWTAIPWRDRPDEARLVDVAHGISRDIRDSPVWADDLLDTHRVRLNPEREVAEMARSAHRLYQVRLRLGPRPEGAAGVGTAASQRAQRTYDETQAVLNSTWLSLVDRAAALANYRRHLGDLAPSLAAVAEVRRLEAGPVPSDVTTLFQDAARNQLAADDTDRITDDADALMATINDMVALLGRDVAMLRATAPPE